MLFYVTERKRGRGAGARAQKKKRRNTALSVWTSTKEQTIMERKEVWVKIDCLLVNRTRFLIFNFYFFLFRKCGENPCAHSIYLPRNLRRLDLPPIKLMHNVQREANNNSKGQTEKKAEK